MKDRKKDHIELAFNSRFHGDTRDRRFDYEPMGSAHPIGYPQFEFLGKPYRIPIWVSSMTGGTDLAGTIDQNLARGCGSCLSASKLTDLLFMLIRFRNGFSQKGTGI